MPIIKTTQDLGHAIRSRRKELGWDQAALAKQIGVSRQWVIDIEKGKPRAELELAIRALHVLGLTLTAESKTVKGAVKSQALTTGQPKFNINQVVDHSKSTTSSYDRLTAADILKSDSGLSLAELIKQTQPTSAADMLKGHSSLSLAELIKQTQPVSAADMFKGHSSLSLAELIKQTQPTSAADMFKSHSSLSLAELIKQNQPTSPADILKSHSTSSKLKSLPTTRPTSSPKSKSASKKTVP
jgi:y4mF family transcriptional regulator